MTRLFILLLLLSSVMVYGQEAVTKRSSPVLHVTGLVSTPLALDEVSLAVFHRHQHKSIPIKSHTGELKREIPAFAGILLSDIIKKAGVPMENHKDQGQYYIVVTASDGYQVVFGYDELIYGADVAAAYLIAIPDNRRPGKDGKYIIVCPGDKITGPRYIKMVEKIEVRKI